MFGNRGLEIVGARNVTGNPCSGHHVGPDMICAKSLGRKSQGLIARGRNPWARNPRGPGIRGLPEIVEPGKCIGLGEIRGPDRQAGNAWAEIAWASEITCLQEMVGGNPAVLPGHRGVAGSRARAWAPRKSRVRRNHWAGGNHEDGNPRWSNRRPREIHIGPTNP